MDIADYDWDVDLYQKSLAEDDMRRISGILADTRELKNLILEHPDYQIAVLCSDDINNGDYSWMYASNISFSIGEILNTQHPFCEEIVYCDRDDFEEDLEEWLWDEMGGNDMGTELSETAFKDELEKWKARFEPCWTNCIIIWANN